MKKTKIKRRDIKEVGPTEKLKWHMYSSRGGNFTKEWDRSGSNKAASHSHLNYKIVLKQDNLIAVSVE